MLSLSAMQMVCVLPVVRVVRCISAYHLSGNWLRGKMCMVRCAAVYGVPGCSWSFTIQHAARGMRHTQRREHTSRTKHGAQRSSLGTHHTMVFDSSRQHATARSTHRTARAAQHAPGNNILQIAKASRLRSNSNWQNERMVSTCS